MAVNALAAAVNTRARKIAYPSAIATNLGNLTMTDQPILVIGATGKTGSRVAARLEAKGLPVRRGARGARIPFDWEEPSTWTAALDGASSAYVTYFPDLAFPGAGEKVEALCAAAKTAGLERFVLLSGRGEHHARLGEDVVRASGLDFTLVRSAWFAQNFSEGYLRDPILSGVLPMPGGDVGEPFIDVDDIADVAVGLRRRVDENNVGVGPNTADGTGNAVGGGRCEVQVVIGADGFLAYIQPLT